MLRLEKIKKDYVSGDSTVQALKDISIEFRKNEFVSILGQSGCGKTTILKLISGFLQPDTGTIEIDGVNQNRI